MTGSVESAIISGFNPHSRTGSDMFTVSVLDCIACFNPHSRTGSDGDHGDNRKGSKRFNPHSRTGSDSRQYMKWG